MGPCDYSSTSSSNTGFGIMSEVLQGRSSWGGFIGGAQSSNSNTSAPPCTPTESVSSVMLISVTVAGFIIIIFATGLVVYIFRKLGWFYVTDPANERLQELRASVAKASQGLDPEDIRAFPVYTFRGDNTFSREVTTETPGLAAFRMFSREISRSFSSSRPISRDGTVSRCSTKEENSSSGEELSKDSSGDNGSTRGEFVVTIEGDESVKHSQTQNDDEALIASLTWACRRECAVCLGEYAAGERIKVVPACAHGFHADCIDLWLAAKTTCPICRRDLSPGKAPSNPTNSTIPISPITQQGDPVPDASVANGTVT